MSLIKLPPFADKSWALDLTRTTPSLPTLRLQGAAGRRFASQAAAVQAPSLFDRLFFDAPTQNPLNEEFPG